jgi:hypothetical protein
MSSQRQIESSRTNGAKSRGPVNTLGKAISSRNHTQPGLSAGTVVLRNEDPALFQALLATNAIAAPAPKPSRNSTAIARKKHPK